MSSETEIDSAKIDQKATGNVSEFRSTMNLALTAIGVGVLALPMAIAQSGYGIGVVLLLITWALTHSMMHLLYKCFQKARKQGFDGVHSYASIGNIAYGKIGKYAVAFSMYLGLSAICVILIQLLGMCLFNLTGSLTQRYWVLISAVCLLPLSCIPTLKEIGILSAIGVVAVVIVCISVLIVAIMIDPQGRGETVAVSNSFSGVAMGFLEFMNGFTVAPVIPSIILGMKNPDRYPRVAAIGFAIIAATFAIVGFGGYLAFGPEILDYGLITRGMSIKAESIGTRAFATVCLVCILIVCLAHFVVMFNPIAVLSDSVVSSYVTGGAAMTASRMIARGSLVGLMVIPAVFIAKFGTVVDIVASTVVLPLQVIMPILFYSKICRDDIHTMSKLSRTVLYSAFSISIAICIGAMVYGLYKTFSIW
jgi:amino acid permease